MCPAVLAEREREMEGKELVGTELKFPPKQQWSEQAGDRTHRHRQTHTHTHTCGASERGKWRRPLGRQQQSQAIGLLSPVNHSSTISLSLVNYWDLGLFLHGACDCVCLQGGFREVSTHSSHSYMISVSVILLLRLFGVVGPNSDWILFTWSLAQKAHTH